MLGKGFFVFIELDMHIYFGLEPGEMGEVDVAYIALIVHIKYENEILNKRGHAEIFQNLNHIND